MSLLTLRGLFERLRAPSQSQKGHFYEKMNALNDTKTPELSKSAKETGNICDCLWRCQSVDKSQVSKWHNLTSKKLSKNKSWANDKKGIEGHRKPNDRISHAGMNFSPLRYIGGGFLFFDRAALQSHIFLRVAAAMLHCCQMKLGNIYLKLGDKMTISHTLLCFVLHNTLGADF